MRSLTNELKMEAILQANKFECFLPKRIRTRKIREKTRVEVVPAVSVYLFVHSDYASLYSFKQQTPGLLFTKVLNSSDSHSTMKVADKEMEDFIRVATQKEQESRLFRPDEVELSRGQRIRIHGGPLSGVEGELVKVKGLRDKRLVISIPGIISVMTLVDRNLIQLIK